MHCHLLHDRPIGSDLVGAGRLQVRPLDRNGRTFHALPNRPGNCLANPPGRIERYTPAIKRPSEKSARQRTTSSETGQAGAIAQALQLSQQFGQTAENTPKTIHSQFGQNYDIKKAGNS